MRRFVSFLLILAMVSPPTVVGAYQGVGSHIRRSSDAPRDLRTNDPASGERAANAFARCVADRRTIVARELLAMPYGSEEQAARSQRLVSGGEECMNNIGFMLRADNARILGGMAEHFLRAVYPEETILSVGALTAEDAASGALAPRNSYETLGLCVARRAPEAVLTFVHTEPGSRQETAAARALSPDIGPCVVQGVTMEFSVPILRSILAVGLYRATTYADSHPASPSIGSN